MNNQKGMVLAVVMIMTIMLAMLASSFMVLSLNNNRLQGAVSGIHMKAYYAAYSGVVWAYNEIPQNPAYRSPSYFNGTDGAPGEDVDVDGDGMKDAHVTITAEGARTDTNPNAHEGVRTITSRSILGGS